MSAQNPQLTDFLLTGNRSNFLYVEGSTVWLNDCPRLLSPLYEAEMFFDRIPIHYQYNVMYIYPISTKFFNYATLISWGINPQNVIALEHSVLTPKPVLGATIMLFEQKHVQSAKRPSNFTVQEAGNYSNAQLKSLWNRILFTIWYYTDVFRKCHRVWLFSYLWKTSNGVLFILKKYWLNPYNVSRVGILDHLLKIASLSAFDWLSGSFF